MYAQPNEERPKENIFECKKLFCVIVTTEHLYIIKTNINIFRSTMFSEIARLYGRPMSHLLGEN